MSQETGRNIMLLRDDQINPVEVHSGKNNPEEGNFTA
jgi:hypothetical protein